MRIRAVWNAEVVAETNRAIVVEGNYYFPLEDCQQRFFEPSDTRTHCPWKGDASYYSLTVGGETNVDCAWTYPNPTEAAAQLEGYCAFWKGVEVVRPSLDERMASLAEPLRALRAALETQEEGSTAEQFQTVVEFLESAGPSALTMLLPREYILSSSFFNFSNSNHICFQSDADFVIELKNKTYDWAFGHLEHPPGQTIGDLLGQMEIIEGMDVPSVLKRLRSYGWVQIPRILTIKDGRPTYLRLDIAITKHGDRDELTGFQGQFVDITHQEELANEVRSSEREMRTIFDGLEEGLLFFGPDGVMSRQRSKAFGDLIPDGGEMVNLRDFFGRMCGTDPDDVDGAVQLMFDRDGFFSSFEDNAQLFPQSVCLDHPDVGERNLRFTYRALNDEEGNLERVLLLVTDETETLKSQAERQRQAERLERIRRAAESPAGFLRFAEETSQLIERCARSFAIDTLADLERNTLERHLHTIKGNCGIFGFAELATAIHDIEGLLADSEHHRDRSVLDDWAQVQARWPEAISDIRQVLGTATDPDFVSLPLEKVHRLEQFASSSANPQLAGLVRALSTQPLHVLMSKYTRLVEGLNARRPNKCAHLTFEEDSSELAPNDLARVDAALVHLLRNAFDHGIESQSERDAQGKPRDGTIRCSLHHSGESAVLSISDDGRGIDTQGLAEAAVKRRIWTREQAASSTEAERLSLVFVDRLSTRAEANELSGRGVGLPAVQAHVTSIGGTLELHTQPGQGTTFTLTFPIGAGSVNQGNAPEAEVSPT